MYSIQVYSESLKHWYPVEIPIPYADVLSVRITGSVRNQQAFVFRNSDGSLGVNVYAEQNMTEQIHSFNDPSADEEE